MNDLHRVDKFILTELLTHETRRFSELRPPGLETNSLAYRLKMLIKQGYVALGRQGYTLTSEGRFFTDRLNLRTFKPRQQPKSVSLLVVRNKNGDWLLHHRVIHPLRDVIGLPHADVRPGESIITSAERRLEEVFGLTGKLRHVGSGFLTFKKNGLLETYNHIDLLTTIKPPTGRLIEDPEVGFGSYFWEPKPDFSDPKYLATLAEYEKMLESKHPVFFEQIIDL